MENDITTSKTFRPLFKEAFWSRNGTVRGNVPLKMDHVFSAFILFAAGLVPALVAFSLELLYHKRIDNKTPGSSLRSTSNIPNDVIATTKRVEEVEVRVGDPRKSSSTTKILSFPDFDIARF